MATSKPDTLERDMRKMKDSNFVSYTTNLRGLYKDKSKQDAAAATAQAATPTELDKKKVKPIMGGSNPDMDDEVRDNL